MYNRLNPLVATRNELTTMIDLQYYIQEGDQKSYAFHPNLLISLLYVVPVTYGLAYGWKIINVVFLWQNYQKKINNLCVGGLGK